jgi:hypothetical protein
MGSMNMRSTLVIMTKHLDCQQLNELIDKLQCIKGVFSVSLTDVRNDSPNQLPLWPDEPVEQKLLTTARSL